LKKLIIPLILLVLGTGAGAATGLFLLPPPTPEPVATCPEPTHGVEGELDHALAAEPEHDTPSGFVALGNQFIVPIIDGENVASLVILSVSIEIPEGEEEPVHNAEPRLKDAFLQVLFDHANTGGFDGTFTATETMRSLRLALDAAAREVLGDIARSVLITDIVRQDV
jgi:hypothetical protein